MTEVNHNLSHLAREFRGLPSSLASFSESLEGSVQTLNESFNSDQISNLESFVDAYNEMQADVQELESQSQTLVDYLNGEQNPSNPEEIDDIERTVRSLIGSVEKFAEETATVTSELIDLGLEEQGSALHDVAIQLNELPSEIRSSLLDDQLFFVLKAHHFPDAVTEEISEYVGRLDSLNPQGRQNIYGALVFVASEYPEAVAKYTDELATRLGNAPRNEQQNILALLVLTSETNPTPSTVVIDQALELIDSDDEEIALYASMVLGSRAETERQAELVSRRIVDLLESVKDDEARINATSVLCEIAESYPSQVRTHAESVAPLLEGQPPSVQQNVVEYLELIHAEEYREEISNLHSNTANEDVQRATNSALKTLGNSDQSGGEESSETDEAATDSLLGEIEEEFSN